MSIRDRLEDAALLWQNGRKHGAWISILIAADATAGLRFPSDKVGDRFRKFIREVTPTIATGKAPAITGGVHIVFGEEKIHLDQLLYKHFRCNLMHEAMLDCNIADLAHSEIIDDKLIAVLRVGSP